MQIFCGDSALDTACDKCESLAMLPLASCGVVRLHGSKSNPEAVCPGFCVWLSGGVNHGTSLIRWQIGDMPSTSDKEHWHHTGHTKTGMLPEIVDSWDGLQQQDQLHQTWFTTKFTMRCDSSLVYWLVVHWWQWWHLVHVTHIWHWTPSGKQPTMISLQG